MRRRKTANAVSFFRFTGTHAQRLVSNFTRTPHSAYHRVSPSTADHHPAYHRASPSTAEHSTHHYHVLLPFSTITVICMAHQYDPLERMFQLLHATLNAQQQQFEFFCVEQQCTDAHLEYLLLQQAELCQLNQQHESVGCSTATGNISNVSPLIRQGELPPTECAEFTRDHLIESLVSDPELAANPVKAYISAFSTTNSRLHASEIDDSMSGTTAITVIVKNDTLFVANVGDSRAVMGVKRGNLVVAEDLSFDQTPFRKDECQRVKLCGARVLSVDQIEGNKDPSVQSWGDEESDDGDPPRLWMPDAMYPGTAFTRSIGDSVAEKIGVIAVPEVKVVHLNDNHLFFVIASDGIFEFLSSQAVVDMVSMFKDPRDACAAISTEAHRLWLEHENRTDDITIIIACINGLCIGSDHQNDFSSLENLN